MVTLRTRSCAGAFAAILAAAPTPVVTAQAPAPAAVVEPPPPAAPGVIARDGTGRVTIRATRIAEPLVVDGRLDEEVYTTVPSFGDFIQQEPHQGQPATEKSEVWVFFDDTCVYVSARFWMDPSSIIANEMRKDQTAIIAANDNIGVTLDTFLDHRSGYYVNTNALGAVRDALLTDENRNGNMDYNLVWDVKSRRFEHGWSTEIAIPFKSLRYPPRREQVWGLLVQRIDIRKNEYSYVTPVPASYGPAGIWKVSSEATLVGIEAPAGGGSLEARPYALGTVNTDRLAAVPTENDVRGAFGGDGRYRVTNGLNADFTYNTDFAQVEVDNAQVNLTRFNLFYPEKRDFFLEGQSVLHFGFTFNNGRQGVDPNPMIFFSRQIGLTAGQAVPLWGGGRLTGRVGNYSVGALSIQSKDSSAGPSTNFTVVRVRRDVFRRSAVGAIYTERSVALGGTGRNRVFGLDAALRPSQDLEVNAYYAASRTAGRPGDDVSYLGQFRYNANRFGLELSRVKVGADFDPQIGFMARRDFTRTFAFARYSPRPRNLLGIRKFSYEFGFDNFSGSSGALQTRVATGTFRTNWNSADELDLIYTATSDRPTQAFRVGNIPIAAGRYDFSEVRVDYNAGARRPYVGHVAASHGSYYGGRRTEVTMNGRIPMGPSVAVEPILTEDWLDLPLGSVLAQVVSTRVSFSFTPRMLVATLVQYNSAGHSVGTNIRYRWEYQPGSDLFVVYTDGRDTLAPGGSTLLGRNVSVKLTRLLRN